MIKGTVALDLYETQENGDITLRKLFDMTQNFNMMKKAVPIMFQFLHQIELCSKSSDANTNVTKFM